MTYTGWVWSQKILIRINDRSNYFPSDYHTFIQLLKYNNSIQHTIFLLLLLIKKILPVVFLDSYLQIVHSQVIAQNIMFRWLHA